MSNAATNDTTTNRMHIVPKILGLLALVALVIHGPTMRNVERWNDKSESALKLEVQRMASVVPCEVGATEAKEAKAPAPAPAPDDNDNDDGLIPDGPTPMILLSLGRSGSGSTWQIIGNLTGMETPSNEYTGSGAASSEEFFEKHKGDMKAKWMLDYLRTQQETFPEAAVVGFKWKPFDTFFCNESIAALQQIAIAPHRGKIKIIRSKRNLLDVHISAIKHLEARAEGSKVRSHCMAGDAKCLEKHWQVGTGLQVPTENLLERLTEMTRKEEAVDHLLQEMGVPHVSVSYERLYYSENNDASEWIRIFQFLKRGPTTTTTTTATSELTMTDVRGAMEHADTSVNSHKVALKNYDEIRELFEGTEFLSLLH